MCSRYSPNLTRKKRRDRRVRKGKLLSRTYSDETPTINSVSNKTQCSSRNRNPPRITERSRSRTRPQPLPSQPQTPTRPQDPNLLSPPPITPTSVSYAPSERSPSRAPSERSQSQGADPRRISFADPPRPTARRLRIPTRTDSLASGFPFDARLIKYEVAEVEWDHFSNEIVKAARVPGPSWTWPFHRKDVIRRIKKELQYECDLKSALRVGNRFFRPKGFQASLELPSLNGDKDKRVVVAGQSKEEKKQAKTEAKRFRIVITPINERAPSVYSRSSSMTRSVTGEGANLQAKLAAETAMVELDRENDS